MNKKVKNELIMTVGLLTIGTVSFISAKLSILFAYSIFLLGYYLVMKRYFKKEKEYIK